MSSSQGRPSDRQVFFCTTLLVVSGLFAKSLIRPSTFDKGFSTDHVVAADVVLPGKAFRSAGVFLHNVIGRLRTLCQKLDSSLDIRQGILDRPRGRGGCRPPR